MTSNSETGKKLRELLDAKATTQNAVADAAGISQPYMNQFTTGVRTPSGDWINLIADVMQLNRKQRVELHRAAAKDKGFEIDL